MNGSRASVSEILKGIQAAEQAGFSPLKINTVVQRGVNDHTLVDLALYFRERGHIVRFIEYMDAGTLNDLSADGKIYLCLFAQGGIDLRTPLWSDASDNLLCQQIAEAWHNRNDHYSETRDSHQPREKVEMHHIGG